MKVDLRIMLLMVLAGCTADKQDVDSSVVSAPGASTETGSAPDATTETGSPPGASPTWHADVRHLVESSCTGCHEEGGIAPFVLGSYADFFAMKEMVANEVSARRMPPWKAVDGCAEYRDDISLSDAEIALIVDWVDNGAPEGDVADTREGTPPPAGVLERVDLTVTLPVAYEVNTSAVDDYRCFPVDWPLEEDVFVTGYEVKPERADLVHHVIAFIIPGSYRDALATLEAEDGKSGYECFGGPGPISVVDSSWLGAWAPGAVQGLLPNGLGIRMKAGDLLVLQMHYNSEEGTTGTDQSAIAFSYETAVEREGWIQPFTSPSWVFGAGMDIPAGELGVEHGFEHTMSNGFTIHSANLHMHNLGKAGRMEVGKADGSTECLIAIDDWDFDWQRGYVFKEPKRIEVGDKWRLSCTWDNPTDADVAWGDGTGDEMCLGSVLMSVD